MKIKDFSEILNGYAFKSSNYINAGYRIIRITNVQSGYLEDEKPVFYAQDDKLNKYELKENDILISLTGNVGRCAMITNDFLPAYLNQRVCCLRINTKKVLPKFLFYLLNSKKFEFDCINSSQGIAQLNMSTEWLKEYNLDIPSVEEQRKIINVFDKVYKNIVIKKKQINAFDYLIKSQFVEMFENDAVSKKQLKTIAKIGSSKRIYASEYKSIGIPFYRSKEIRELGTGLKPSVELFIDESKYNYVKDKFGVPKKGDILVAAIGATIGYMWVVDDSKFYYKDGNLINISPFDKVSSIYLKYVLEKIINDYKIKNASGSAQLAMTIEKIEKFEIPVPSIELQNKFAAFVKQVDKQKFNEVLYSLKYIKNMLKCKC